MPENTISVTRPGKWGNPFRVIGESIFVDAGHRQKNLDKWVFLCLGDAEKAVSLFKSVLTNRLLPGEYGFKIDMISDIAYHAKRLSKLDLSELQGKNLACFCPADKPCHADVLIEVCNLKELRH